MDPGTIRFGEFELDPARQELRRSGELVAVQPKPFAVLQLLVEERERVVSKEEIHERVWPGVAVSDASLSTAMKDVRRALGDDAHAQRWVKTLRGRGFRFIGDVDVEAKATDTRVSQPPRRSPVLGIAAAAVALGALAWWLGGLSLTPPTARPAPSTSLVVLPFDDLSPDGDKAYLAHGMSEELTSTLSGVPELRVVARTSAEVAKQRDLTVEEIGQTLGVGAVVEGSVRSEDGQLRVTVQLVGAHDGFHLWSESFDRPHADLLRLQHDIALAVADALLVELGTPGPSGGTTQAQAYDLLLQSGFQARTELGTEAALRYVEEALALDPGSALGHTYAAWRAYDTCQMGFGDCSEWLPRSRAAAERAVALDPALPNARCAKGWMHALHYEWAEAEAESRRALELRPDYPCALVNLGSFRLIQGDMDGLGELERAVEVDPLNRTALMNIGNAYGLLQIAPEKAVLWLEKARRLGPDNRGTRLVLASALETTGRKDEARAALLKAGFPASYEEKLGAAFDEGGMAAATARLLELESERTGSPCTDFVSFGAVTHARLGNLDQSLACLEQGQQTGSLGPTLFLKLNPAFEPLRANPRFEAVLERMGLAGMRASRRDGST